MLTDEEKTAVAKMVDWVKEYESSMTIDSLAEENEVTAYVDTETGEVIEQMYKS